MVSYTSEMHFTTARVLDALDDSFADCSGRGRRDLVKAISTEKFLLQSFFL